MSDCDQAFQTLYECFALAPELRSRLDSIRAEWDQFRARCQSVIYMSPEDAASLHDDLLYVKTQMDAGGVCYSDPVREFDELTRRVERVNNALRVASPVCYQALLEKYGYDDIDIADLHTRMNDWYDRLKEEYQIHLESIEEARRIISDVDKTELEDVMTKITDDFERVMELKSKLKRLYEIDTRHRAFAGDDAPFCWHHSFKRFIEKELGINVDDLPVLLGSIPV